jgi:hypothetical protein
LLVGGAVVSRHPLSGRPFHLGRGPANDLILTDDATSARHLRVWVDGGRPVAEDLGSRNGSWLNGERLERPTAMEAGDELRVGAGVLLRIRQESEGLAAVPELEDVEASARVAFARDRLVIADRDTADVRVAGAGAGVTLLVEPDGAVWLGQDGSLRPLVLDEPFTVGGRRFCLRPAAAGGPVTRNLVCPHELRATRYPDERDARLDGPTGARAVLRDMSTRAELVVSAENPALLLYLLARQNVADRTAGTPPADCGWLSDPDLAVGIWGRSEGERQEANLNVLIWRVRRELQAAGFDPWWVEKRRKHTRVRLEVASVR